MKSVFLEDGLLDEKVIKNESCIRGGASHFVLTNNSKCRSNTFFIYIKIMKFNQY